MILLLAAETLLSGCTHYDAIKGSDSSVNSPLLRVSTALGNGGPDAIRLELRHARQEGEFHQTFAHNENVLVEGTDFSTPTTINASGRFSTTHVRASIPHWLKEGTLRVDTDLGLSMIDARVKVTDAAHSATLENVRFAPLVGGALVLNNAQGDLGLRAGLDLAWAGEVATDEAELLGSYAPTRSLEFLLGYRYFKYSYKATGRSDFEVEFSGPAAGLHLRF